MPGAFTYGMTPSNSPKGSAFQAIQPTVIPVGVIQMFAGSVAPTGWLICDGSSVSRKTYSDLFKVIGTTYGVGNSNDLFTLPDMRGRVPMGVGQGVGLTARTLAATTGVETVALSTSEMPLHNHTASDSGHSHTTSVGNETADHSHTPNCDGINLARGAYGFSATGGGYQGILIIRGNDTGSQTSTTGRSAVHQHAVTVNTGYSSISVGNSGSGSAHNNMQPSIAINFIIKT
jgi:microcystin-dependent protein